MFVCLFNSLCPSKTHFISHLLGTGSSDRDDSSFLTRIYKLRLRMVDAMFDGALYAGFRWPTHSESNPDP